MNDSEHIQHESMSLFELRQDCLPQTYGLGLKELWEIPKDKHASGLIWHSVGWPLRADTYGGSWLNDDAEQILKGEDGQQAAAPPNYIGGIQLLLRACRTEQNDVR
jgi:hypothetical protein